MAVAATTAIYTSSDRGALFKAIEESVVGFGFDYVLLAFHKTTKQDW